MDVFDSIAENRNNLSKSFTKVADFICNNYEEVAFMSVTEVARGCGVSESVIVRFSTFLGFSGFVDLKKNLADKIKNKLQLPTRMSTASTLSENNTNDEIMMEALNKDIDNILSTMKEPYNKSFDQIITTLHNAKKIYIIGNRGLYKIAELSEFLFDLTGLDCIAINVEDSYEFRKLRMIHKDCVLLAISLPRYCNQINIALQIANKKKAKTIVISDNPFSADARIAHYSLITSVKSYTFINSYCSIISVINAIVTAISVKYRVDTIKSLTNVEEWLHHFNFKESR